MSEPMLHTEIWSRVSELMLHMKMCNVLTYVTRKYEMCFVRTYVAYEYVICPNQCYEQTYDYCVRYYVAYGNEMGSIRTYGIYEKLYIRIYIT